MKKMYNHRVIINILLLGLFVYRVYLMISNYELFASIRMGGSLSGWDRLYIFGLSALPYVAIVLGFVANFMKRPIDIYINKANCLLCCAAFCCEGIFWMSGEMSGSGAKPWEKPLINILVCILTGFSIFFSLRTYKKT